MEGKEKKKQTKTLGCLQFEINSARVGPDSREKKFQREHDVPKNAVDTPILGRGGGQSDPTLL